MNGDFPRARQIAKLWGKLHQAAATERGWKVDNVFDLARILRPPGTMNGKGEPLPVEVLEHEGARYSVEELAELARYTGVPGARGAQRPA